jgi:hypothetical protein
MMRRQTTLVILVLLALMVLAGFFFDFWLTEPEPLPVFPATVNRDCAPWDGSAFTVQVPLQDGRTIYISIWKSPEFHRPVRFTFPDSTGQVGNAMLVPAIGTPNPLSGDVTFQGVEREMAVQGQYDLSRENGENFKGKFVAEWGNDIVLCG